jgi:outer membrane lipoprotein SlyB
MEFLMRKMTLAVAAATMAVPAAMTLPASEAQAFQYDRNGNYIGRTWRGRDGRYYCRKPNGTTGLIVGGAAGAIAGHQIAGRGDKTLGAIIGGAAGALLGREVERGLSRRRCR